jgi:beta-phosphoglucomutase-like phosphatase (HAD superfamily)
MQDRYNFRLPRLNEKHSLKIPIEEVLQRKEECYFNSLPDLKAVPEVLEHIHSSYGRIPLAVVPGSKRDSVTASLTSLGLLEKFQLLVCAEDYKRGKPNPEPFLLAATKLRLNPGSCLVFEDTKMGIQAAQSAGMATVGVPPPWERYPGLSCMMSQDCVARNGDRLGQRSWTLFRPR